MKVNRISEVKPYEAKKHFDMKGLRLQGFEASPSKNFWVGLSYFLPGGGAEMSESPLERVYVVVEGEVVVVTDEGETTLKKMDSCLLAGGERRAIVNRTNVPASILVIMPYPEGAGR